MKLYVFREMSVDGFLARLSRHHPLAILLALVVLHSAVSSKAFGQNQAAETEVPRTNPTGADPKPENATEAILAQSHSGVLTTVNLKRGWLPGPFRRSYNCKELGWQTYGI